MRFSTILAVLATLALSATPALAEGDASAGRKVFKQCRNCHSVKAGKYGTFGPNLYQVVGREAGTAPEHSYSSALKNSGIIWTVDTLDRWLADPQALVPGAGMEFHLESAQERANVIAYLVAASKR
jgi:cytochrome c2